MSSQPIEAVIVPPHSISEEGEAAIVSEFDGGVGGATPKAN